MSDVTIRPYRSPADARSQYELWLRATEGLTRPWRSSLRNVEHQLRQCEKYPRCRLYAEAPDGALLGYVGTHPPFEWEIDVHGPPAVKLGWAIPFGYPWTDPRDDKLAGGLYDQMCRAVPEMYADFQRDTYIQRFRESWTYPIEFLKARGWQLQRRLPLVGRVIEDVGAPPTLATVTRDDLELVGALAEADPHTEETLTPNALRDRYDGGWIADTFWRVGESGVFALEQRGRWSAVTLLYSRPESWDDTLQAAAAQAATLGAEEIYFTIDPDADRKLDAALRGRGFGEVDAGVYYVREAD